MSDKNKYDSIKTTKGRNYNKNYISYIEQSLISRGFNNKQISVILGNIIEESGGDPFAKSENGTYHGLLQWSDGRYRIDSKSKDIYNEIDNQLDYLVNSIQKSDDRVSWTHGGEGSGYSKGTQAKSNFFDDNNDISKIHKAFSFGYVRPKGKHNSYNNRLKVIKQVDDIRHNLGTGDELPITPKVIKKLDNLNNIIPDMSTIIDTNKDGYRCGGTIRKRKRKDFGGVLTDKDYEFSVSRTDDRSYFENNGTGFRSNYLSNAYDEGDLTLSDLAISKSRNLKSNDINTYNNMQNKIQTEILQARGIAKFGGLIGKRRKRMYWGGTTLSDPSSVGWGTQIKTEDITHDEYTADGEGIIGGSTTSGLSTGLGVGATVGIGAAALGAGTGSVLGPIGAGIGALIGGIVGLFTGRKKKKQEERRRQEIIATQKEAERQQTLGNMQNKVENDVATIRQQNNESYSEGSTFYAKLGGLIPRRKLATGGQVLPNSTNSVVAYGATHEQYNGLTGETGIPFGDAEIEGGGNYNGKQYAGEVVRKTNNGDQVFSDTLKVPGTKNTFADYAKALTDVKGSKEQSVFNYSKGLNIGLNRLSKSKLNKLETGTNVRNLEKDVYRMNKARGEAEFIDRKTAELFNGQEQYATVLGLREPTDNFEMGGLIGRPKYKFGFMEMGLASNLAGSAIGMIGNALNTRANRKAIEFERSLAVPKQSKLETMQYSTDYDIDQELQELTTQERRASNYIKDNTSNIQVARNSIGKLAIDAQIARNKIYGSKKDYQRQRYDMNLAERINTNNRNNQILYEDSLAEYNKAIQLNSMNMQNRTQGLQGMLQGIDSIGSTINNYTSGKLYEKLWAKGVKKEMGQMACGGMIRRKKRK